VYVFCCIFARLHTHAHHLHALFFKVERFSAFTTCAARLPCSSLCDTFLLVRLNGVCFARIPTRAILRQHSSSAVLRGGCSQT